MEIVFWVMMTLVGLLLFAISYFIDSDDKSRHHDDRHDSYYQISQRKDKI